MRPLPLAAALLAACCLAAPAEAQRSGTYALVGVADGTRYEGIAELRATGPDTWRITWRIAGEVITGVGMMVGPVMVVGYQHGREPGVAAYDVLPDGRLAGRWTTGRAATIGTEVWMPR